MLTREAPVLDNDDSRALMQPSRSAEDLLAPLLKRPYLSSIALAPLPSVVVGELVAITEGEASPLVTFPGQPGPGAIRARSTLDLGGEHIGRSVLLSFENGDAALPIVTGVLRQPTDLRREAPQQVHVEADGTRLVVQAQEKLVLRCGDASITLTQAGKVLIQGKFISSRATGLNRITGGSVQLN
jgi:hypothetical protein